MARAKSDEPKLLRATESYVTAVDDGSGREVDYFVRRGDLLDPNDPAVRHPYVVPADATAAEERIHRRDNGLFQAP